ncbi:hypothetical protein PVMG_06039 [Plasmodium vivax Mauritania I]|uniref:Uncharacterized protein n=1 Tax=Plasmodium vivax Mauritania I TaxID=1035515 RepID=A0A0J9TEW5_PLAVI|nr:hypothetical protein PVMG_06039 [Plasmodium vivax Mauritania I]
MYNAVSTFSTYEPILEGFLEDPTLPNNEWCNGNVQKFARNEISSKKIICAVSIKYLEEIKKTKDNNYISNGYKYLYYRIYENKQNEPEYSDITFKFFKDLLENYASKETSILKDNTEQINNDIFGKLKNLKELYDNFYKYEKKELCGDDSCGCAEKCAETYKTYLEECNSEYYSTFCVELQKFGEKFNEYIRGNNHCIKEIEKLPLFNKNNPRIAIIGSGVVLAIIVFSLFTLYKVS